MVSCTELFAEFTCYFMSITSIDFGAFVEIVIKTAKSLDEPDLITSLTISLVNMTIEMTLEKTLTPAGLAVTLGMMSILVSLPAVILIKLSN